MVMTGPCDNKDANILEQFGCSSYLLIHKMVSGAWNNNHMPIWTGFYGLLC